MDKNKICEALYALPGDVVVKRRKSQLVPTVLFFAGAAMLVVNMMYGTELSNDLQSAMVFLGGVLVVVGMIMAAAKVFGAGGVPFHKEKSCYLLYDELCFDRNIRGDVMQSMADGAVDELLNLKRAHVPALTVAIYRSPDNRFAAMQAFEYADLEYRPLSELKIVTEN